MCDDWDMLFIVSMCVRVERGHTLKLATLAAHAINCLETTAPERIFVLRSCQFLVTESVYV